MNDQNNQSGSSLQSDLNSILSSAPQPPNNPLAEQNPLSENSSPGGGLMSPPISATPPTSDLLNPQPPASNPPPPVDPDKIGVDVPQFGASPFATPLTTQSDPTLPQSPPASSGSSGFGTILESSLPGGANPPQEPQTQQPQNFDWPKSPANLSGVQEPTPSNPPTESVPPTPTQQEGTAETPPTDLSHLVEPSPVSNEGNPSLGYNPPTTQPETLVIPATVSDTTGQAQVATAKQGIPKWIIILGVVLLLAVAAASAYFILGIGRNSGEPPPASAPATSQQQQIVPPAATTPTPVATSSAQPVATGSAGFSGVNQQATSAADLLRQRQGR